MDIDDFTRPSYAPFAVDAVYEWIECDLPKYAGFRIEARLNLRNRERKQLIALLDDQEAERKRISDNGMKRGTELQKRVDDLDARRTALVDAGDTDALAAITEESAALAEERASLILGMNAAYAVSFGRIHEAIAPHIRDWNLAYHDDGVLIDVPPPAEIGAEAFEDVDQTLLTWIVSALLSAYRGGKGLSGSSTTPGEPDAPPPASNGTPPSAKPTTSRRKQSRRSAESLPSLSAST
jgi:hypothetical protein